jgi:hypothetical protein
MNAQTLASTLRFLADLDTNLGVQMKLETVVESLNNIVQSSAHPQYQSALAVALTALEQAVVSMTGRISPAARSLIRELRGETFFDPGLAIDVKQSVVTNAMTPAVARDFVRDLATKRDAYISNVRTTSGGVRDLGINGDELSTGSAEIALMIPREVFSNNLGMFAKELIFLNRLISHIGEVLTSQAEPIILGHLSSSDPTITLQAGLESMKFLGLAVIKFLEAWKKIVEIREILQKLKKVGMASKSVATELTEEITSTVEEVVEESATEIISHSRLQDGGRKNELGALIKKDLRRLFAQVERGLVVEIRVNPAASEEEGGDENLSTLKSLSHSLQFPVMTDTPILISGGDIEEDEEFVAKTRRYKKTITTKTTSTKRVSSSKGDKEDKN